VPPETAASAAGQQAQALHNGGLCLGGFAKPRRFASTGNDQFCIRAQGGMKLDNSTSVAFGSATRQIARVISRPDFQPTFTAIGVQTGTL